MKLLILGGTVFLGRHLVEAALARGHEVTLFNRGQQNPELFPEIEKIRGDRDGDLSALKGRSWDAVIDTCGYVPRIVSKSASLLADAVHHYTFISSISAYHDFSQIGITEDSPVGKLQDESIEEHTGESYGPLKALCEQAVEQAMPDRSLVVRAGLIVGPHDKTDRFTYWPHRIGRGGHVIAPGNPQQTVQFIDVRDLAEWVLIASENRVAGAYNATGPVEPITMKELLETCMEVLNPQAELVWASDSFLLDQGVQEWIEMPLWISERTNWPGFMSVNCRKAQEMGLRFRPLSETIRDTFEWDLARTEAAERKAGISPAREKQLLELLK